jgi:predicted  nucleic acid-binding Zn-ribbon protein
MSVDEIEEELSVSRYDLERAEEELDAALQAVTSLTEEVEFTRSHIARLERQWDRAVAKKKAASGAGYDGQG